jgi:PPM family protein phosphatase
MKLVEQYLWFQEEKATIHEIACQSGLIVGFTERSSVGKSVNEDAVGVFVFDEQTIVLAVADGMGGANSGDRAAQTVIQSIAQQVQLAVVRESLRTNILDAIESANQEILSWGIGAGATLVVGVVIENEARVFHVGDAEALVCSNRGRVKFSTIAHTPVAMAVESGMLNEQEAMHHEDRNIVNNHVGLREMRIEIGPSVEMGLHDTLLLASDGLFDNLMIHEIVELIRPSDLAKRAGAVLNHTHDRMLAVQAHLPNKPDDLSVLMFRRTHSKSANSV